MAHHEDERKAFGRRLAAARNKAGLTLEGAAQRLTDNGHPIGKAAIGAWEKGRNLPDAIWLQRLAKLYGLSLDALVWDDTLSIEAMRFAARYDALDEQQQRAFRALWAAYFEQTKPEPGLPLPPGTPKPKANGGALPHPH